MSEQPLSTIKALTFDVFGTIVDWRGSVQSQLAEWFELRNIERDWNAFALDWRALYQPSMAEVREGLREFVILDVLHRESLLKVLAGHNIPNLTTSELDELTRIWHSLRPWPDAVPALQLLRTRFVLAALSNGNVQLMKNLSRNAQLPWHVILGAEPAQSYKPQARAYLFTASSLALEPSECLMVAAHNSDLAAARKLGFRTAYINRPREYGTQQSTDLGAEDNWDFVGESLQELAIRLVSG